MAASAKSLMRAGLISPKAFNSTLSKTRPQKSKMAKFHNTERDEASGHKRAEVPSNEINHPTNQADRARSMPSRGGSVGRTGGVPRGHIDVNTGKKYPAQSSVKRSGRSSVGVRGGVTPNGPLYGGGARNAQG